MTIEKIIFGTGCFWGVEATFHSVLGVVNVKCGYAHGHTRYPDYHDVCSDQIGHAEAVLVEYDASLVSFGNLLNTFWCCVHLTTLNRQGRDIDSQYQSTIFFIR